MNVILIFKTIKKIIDNMNNTNKQNNIFKYNPLFPSQKDSVWQNNSIQSRNTLDQNTNLFNPSQPFTPFTSPTKYNSQNNTPFASYLDQNNIISLSEPNQLGSLGTDSTPKNSYQDSSLYNQPFTSLNKNDNSPDSQSSLFYSPKGLYGSPSEFPNVANLPPPPPPMQMSLKPASTIMTGNPCNSSQWNPPYLNCGTINSSKVHSFPLENQSVPIVEQNSYLTTPSLPLDKNINNLPNNIFTPTDQIYMGLPNLSTIPNTTNTSKVNKQPMKDSNYPISYNSYSQKEKYYKPYMYKKYNKIKLIKTNSRLQYKIRKMNKDIYYYKQEIKFLQSQEDDAREQLCSRNKQLRALKIENEKLKQKLMNSEIK